MFKVFVILVFALMFISCGDSDVLMKSQSSPFTFPTLTDIHSKFDSVNSLSISSTVVDTENNVYVLMDFNGVIDGVTTGANDLVILKFKSDGTLTWKKHLRSTLDGILDSSLDEFAESLIIEDKGNALYFSGRTKSSFIENNLGTGSSTSDIIAGKLSTDGEVLWVKHYGQATQDNFKTSLSNPDINFAEEDQAGQIKQASSGVIVIPFQTKSSLFELSAGGWDIGAMLVNQNNGTILKGRQLGAVTLSTVGAGGTGDQRTGDSSSIDFDGTKIVMPFYSADSLVETNNGAGTLNSAYVVYNDDLNVEIIKELGLETYTAWVSDGNFNGTIAGSEQFRSVLVLSPGEYLFFGKVTSANLAEERNGTEDLFFARYKNHELVSLKQLGAVSLPYGIFSEQARTMVKDNNGNIFCSGHTQSSLFDNVSEYSPFVLRIDKDGNVLGGIQFGSNAADSLGLSAFHKVYIAESEFIIKDGTLLVGIKHDPPEVGSDLKQNFLWSIPFLKVESLGLITCPTGFIPVPHNSSVGTDSDFCVMKYEAKNNGSNVAISQAAGHPYTNLSILSSQDKCTELNAINGISDKYDLISNAEWMTIARNAESVSVNYGSGVMARGWSASSSNGDTWTNTSVAPSSDVNCLYNTGVNTCASTGTHRYKRTLTLTNGQEIWDLSGNVWEWVDWDGKTLGTDTGPKTCLGGWVDFPALLTDPCYSSGALSANEVLPLTSGGSSVQGFGRFNGNLPAQGPNGGAALRGGHWGNGANAGAFTLYFSGSTANSGSAFGFRCVYRP